MASRLKQTLGQDLIVRRNDFSVNDRSLTPQGEGETYEYSCQVSERRGWRRVPVVFKIRFTLFCLLLIPYGYTPLLYEVALLSNIETHYGSGFLRIL